MDDVDGLAVDGAAAAVSPLGGAAADAATEGVEGDAGVVVAGGVDPAAVPRMGAAMLGVVPGALPKPRAYQGGGVGSEAPTGGEPLGPPELGVFAGLA